MAVVPLDRARHGHGRPGLLRWRCTVLDRHGVRGLPCGLCAAVPLQATFAGCLPVCTTSRWCAESDCAFDFVTVEHGLDSEVLSRLKLRAEADSESNNLNP